MSKRWLLLVHLWNSNGDDARHLSNKNLVCLDVSPLRSMDGILHMRAKCWRRPWCALSMVRDQSQIGLYVHWIAPRGGYGLAAEWSLHPCVLPCLSLPLEDAAYSLWISGMHGSFQDTMEILWKLGCGPLKSCSRGDACAWTGCLQLIVRSKWPKNAYTCVLLLPVEMTADYLAFSVENPSHCPSDQPVWEEFTHPPMAACLEYLKNRKPKGIQNPRIPPWPAVCSCFLTENWQDSAVCCLAKKI